MPFATTPDGVSLCFDTQGDPTNPTILLVMGLSAQLTAWNDTWCGLLVNAGFHVVRLDNRDAGLSTKFDGAGVDLPAVMAAWETDGPMPPVPYKLPDMANDAVAVLDHLGIQRAHIVGASLGGMIVQTMAIHHPTRVASLTSIMSTTGERSFYASVPEVRAKLFRPVATDRAAAIADAVDTWSVLSAPKYFDPVAAAARAAAAYDRSYYPQGTLRQTAAIRASGSRDAALATLTTPTLVIHGRQDQLILPSAGIHTADVIPNADLLLVHHMGHDLPEPLAPFLTGAIAAHARRADLESPAP
jgi:pimeloyl-ACP methyl ester carboxylesterase